jgi:uncharacterized protein YecT (DUF1311 family)
MLSPMSKDRGMKSAYELAMERLDKTQGKSAPLTAEQKQQIADIESRARADTAQLEIMMQQRSAEARSKGEGEKLEELERQRVAELARIRDRAETEKAKIRG